MTECTGEIHHSYYLSYDGFVPKNLKKRLERVTHAMMENGLEQFYWTYARFTGLINYRFVINEYEETNNQILGLEQFYIFLAIYGIFISIAIVVFVIELIVYRLKRTN